MGVGEELLKRVDELHTKVDKLLAAKPAAAPSAPAGAVASDEELDGKWGDVEIKKDPRRWSGAPLAPIRASQAPPEYLDVYASFREWQAQMDEKNGTDDDLRKAEYARRDAARARGWAKRHRAAQAASPLPLDEVPF